MSVGLAVILVLILAGAAVTGYALLVSMDAIDDDGDQHP